MNIYQEELLDHYWHPKNRGSVSKPSFSATEHNPLCGDTLTIAARVEHDILIDIKFNGNGCSISQAAAELLTGALMGKKMSHVRAFSSADLYALLKVPISPAREKCALLAFNALQNGLKPMHTIESVKQALKQVKDPELNCDIVSLGLVYAIRIPDARHIEADVTFTSMGCPAGPYILSEVQRVIDELEGAPESTVNLVWEPAWTKDRVDPLVREELMGGI